MDALAQLAIMSKAATVFSTDETYLSFPVTPLAFTAAQLNLLASDADGLNNLIAFSEVVNRIPDGVAWEPGTDTYLWTVLGQVLAEGQFAWSSRTADEERDYQHVRSLLFTTHEDGTRTRTPAVEVYRVKRDAYLLAGQQLRAIQLTLAAMDESVANGTAVDPAVHDTARVDEQAATARMLAAKADWEGEGNRHLIEAAEALLSSLEQKSPVVLRDEWSTRFDPHTATLTRAQDDLQVYPTSFSPANAVDDGSWRPLVITGPEILATAGAAPAELQQRFASEGSSNDLLSISFEFSSAGLTRPWLDTSVFTSRVWRFPGDTLLSDGGTPAHGICPAYTAGVVFARKVTVERRTPAPPSEGAGSLGLQFEIANMPVVTTMTRHPELRLQLPERDVDVARLQDRISAEDTVNVLRHESLSDTVLSDTVLSDTVSLSDTVAVGGTVSLVATEEQPSLLTQRLENSSAIIALDTTLAAPALQLGAVGGHRALTSLRSSSFLRDLLASPPEAALYETVVQPATAPEQPASTTTTDDSIFIVAFICRPLPRCPEPDPTVQWAPT